MSPGGGSPRTAGRHLPTACSFQREAPEHALLPLVEAVFGGGDAPAARELPAARAELVEEGDGVAGFDRREQRAVAGREVLVAVATLARVDDGLAVFGERVRVAGVDAAEVREQRDEPLALVVDAVADAVRAADLRPREDGAAVFGAGLARVAPR